MNNSFDQSADVPNSSGTASRWRSVVALVIAMLAAFLAVGAIGAREAARGARVLPFLDPLVGWIRSAGVASMPWLEANSGLVGWATLLIGGAIALAGLTVARRRAAPLVVLAAAVSFAVWGQVLLLQDRVTLAVWLYGCGVACAVVLGVWCPMRRLGFPELPLPTRREPLVKARETSPAAASMPSCWYPPWKWECALIFLLTVTALFTRTYALTELPHFFDLEMIVSMAESRTLYGLRSYLQGGLLTNSGGIIHLFPKMFLFDLFGTSIYTLRLSGVLFGVAAIPLMYWLVRRMAGAAPAIVATLLLIASPYDLFWSRTENTHFAPLAMGALVSAHLGLWLVERLSFRSVVAAALWMPFCRLFYAAGINMFLYPVALFGHALLFVRGAWRRAWYVVPVLAGGVALWMLSFSFLYSAGNDWHWQYIDATSVYGAPAWRKLGAFNQANWPDLVRLQAVSMTNNFVQVLKNMTYSVPGYSHWSERADLSPAHKTSINLGLAVLSALGLGYLLGQFYDRRAFALLAWVGLALLPAIMSDDPADRRMALVFPALAAVAAVTLGAMVRLVRSRAGRLLERFTTGALGVAVAGVVGTSLASHFLMPIGPTWVDGPIRFTKPLFEKSDVIFNNVEIWVGLVFGNLDRFLEANATPCLQSVDSKGWLQAALRPQCNFTEPVYRAMFSPEQIAALRAAYNPKRVSFLLQDVPYSHPQIALLRQLFPAAQVREYQPPTGQIGNRLVAITASISDIETLRSPSLRAGPDEPEREELKTRLLQGVQLKPSSATSETNGTGHGIVIRGGLLLERDGWYRFAVAPSCADATFTIDSRPAPAADAEPMAAGVHAFEITLPNSTSCQLPLRMLMQAHDQHEMHPVPPDSFVGPAVAALPRARAATVVPYAGYGKGRPLVAMQGTPLDFGVDAQGYMNVLLRDGSGLRVQRFDPDGRLDTTWQPQFPGDGTVSMAVGRDGVSALMSGEGILLTDRAGKRIASWRDPSTWATQLAFWPHDRILKPMQFRNSIRLLSRDGNVQREWNQFEGGPRKFEQPVTVAVGPLGHILVIQADGLALLFQNSTEEWAPTFVRSFRIDFDSLPVGARTCVFDGTDRIVISNNPANGALVYNLDGERMIAAEPERDLNSKAFGEIVRMQSHGDQLYVLSRAGKLWSVSQ